LAEIARELNVDVVVEGSAQRVGGSVRIMAQLIDPETEQALWAESYERDLENILILQSDVAQAIAGEVKVALTPEEATRLAAARPVNPEVHDAYLKGSYHMTKVTPVDLDTAERYFDLALEKDPSYAPAYSGLAKIWAGRQLVGITAPHVAGPKVKAAAQQAIALDEASAEAHEALAMAKTNVDWDWAGAEPEWRRTLELDPNAADAHAFFAVFLAMTGRTDEAIPYSVRSLELDPFSALFHGLYSMVLYLDRRYDDALAAARTALAMHPNQQPARGIQQCVFIAKGMRDEQLADQRQRIAGDPERVAAFEKGLAEGGYEGAQRAIADLLAARYEMAGGIPDPGVRRVYMPSDIALRYIDAGDYDRAIDWLERAFEVRDPNLPYFGLAPIHDPLRDNPRFQDLLRRMNLLTTDSGSAPDEQR
jgi:tetratricopeptide (TPR) repeat protein